MLRRQYLDHIAHLQVIPERHHAAVHPRADALVPDVRVNKIGEIERRRAQRQLFHFPLWREHVDVRFLEVAPHRVHQFVGGGRVLKPFIHLAQPGQLAVQLAVFAVGAFLVHPVRRNAFTRRPVHLFRANLHLHRAPILAHHRGMDGLIEILLRHGHIVFHPAGHRRPEVVHNAERVVAARFRLRDDADAVQVKHFLKALPLRHHLPVDAVQVLGTADHPRIHLRFVQPRLQE